MSLLRRMCRHAAADVPPLRALQGITAASPSDRAAYLRRLRTFRPGLWAGRPGCVGAVAAARRGWCCVRTEADVLACETCSARLAFPIPHSWTPQQTQQVRSRTLLQRHRGSHGRAVAQAALAVAPKLSSAHKAGCAWRVRGSQSVCAVRHLTVRAHVRRAASLRRCVWRSQRA